MFRITVETTQLSSLVVARGKRSMERDEKGAQMSYSYPPKLTWWIAKPVQSCHLPRVLHSLLIKAATKGTGESRHRV
jgi:hypothetical protein